MLNVYNVKVDFTMLLPGCARTEGYYKISHQEKHSYLTDFRGVVQTAEEEAKVFCTTSLISDQCVGITQYCTWPYQNCKISVGNFKIAKCFYRAMLLPGERN